MKITFKSADELKAHAKEKLQEFIDAGLEHAAALKKVNAYLAKSEFSDESGAVLKLTLEDGGDDANISKGMAGNAIAEAVTAGVTAAMKGLNLQTSGKAASGAVTVESDDWERLLEAKRSPDAKWSNWDFPNIAEFAQATYLSTKANTTLDHRLALLQKANTKIKHGLDSGAITYQKAHKWGGIIEKATPTTYASELVGADGGFLVPPEYREEIWIAVRDDESILSMCDLTPTNSNVVNMTADQNMPWDNTAGITTGWRAQGTTMTQSKPVFQNRQVQLNEIYALVPATDELIQDTPQLNNYLSVKAPQKIGWRIDEAIFRGNGNGQPLGFITSNAMLNISSSSAASTYTPVDFANMLGRFLQPNMKSPRGCWIMTPRAYSYSINLNLGTLGFPLALANQSIQSGLTPSILGLPVYVSQHTGAWSSANDVILVDLKAGYAAFNKTNGIDFQTSIHLFFDAGATAFRWRFRVGGEPYLKSVITPANDTSNTMSHFVGLPTRS